MCLHTKSHPNSLEFIILFCKKYIEQSVLQFFRIPVMLLSILQLSPQMSNVINQELNSLDQKQRLRDTPWGKGLKFVTYMYLANIYSQDLGAYLRLSLETKTDTHTHFVTLQAFSIDQYHNGSPGLCQCFNIFSYAIIVNVHHIKCYTTNT